MEFSRIFVIFFYLKNFTIGLQKHIYHFLKRLKNIKFILKNHATYVLD